MSFKPAFSLVRIPRSQDLFSVKDITGSYPTVADGYGSSNAPANLAAITSVWGDIQNYGDILSIPTARSGSISSEYIFTVAVKTGVSTLRVWYGEQISASWTLSTDRRTITFALDPSGWLDGVSAISLLGEYPTVISTITSNVLTLATPLPGTGTSGTTVFRYFAARLNTLVIFEAERRLANRITSLPLEEDFRNDIVPVMEMLLLKVAAQIEFDCGKWSKAHDAACLASNIIPLSVTQNYPPYE